MPVTLPPPLPGLALRFTISAAFSTLALGLLPFFLVGLLLRCIFAPLTSLYERYAAGPRRKSKTNKDKATTAKNNKAVANGTAVPSTSTVVSGRASPRLRLPQTAAQVYAHSSTNGRLAPPSPASPSPTA